MAVLNVQDYGATGDGGHIDSDPINRAIDYLTENYPRGGVLYFPPGTYKLDSKIQIRNVPITLRGDGKSHSRLLWVNAEDEGGLSLHGSGVTTEDTTSFTVEKLAFITQDNDAGNAIDVQWPLSDARSPVKKLVIRDVEVTSFNYGGTDQGKWKNGIRAYVPWEIEISHTRIHNPREAGIVSSYPGCAGLYLSEIYVNLAHWGIRIRHGAEGVCLTNASFVNVVNGIEALCNVDENGRPVGYGGTVFQIVNTHIDCDFRALELQHANNIQISNLAAWRHDRKANDPVEHGPGIPKLPNYDEETDLLKFTDCNFVAVGSSRVSSNRPGAVTNGIRLIRVHPLFAYANWIDVPPERQIVVEGPGSTFAKWPST